MISVARKFQFEPIRRFSLLAVLLVFASLSFSSGPVAGDPKPGTLRIKTTPPNCAITINDSAVSDFKKKGQWLEVKRPPGVYDISATDSGLTDSFHIEIFSDDITYVRVNLVPTPDVFVLCDGYEIMPEVTWQVYRKHSSKVEIDPQINVSVDTTGIVQDVRVAKSCGDRQIDDEVVAAVRRSKFSPHYINEQRITGWVTRPVKFSLKRQ